MRVLFDTSIIIAALVVSHEQHTACVRWLNQAKTEQIQGIISTHSFAETYSVITRRPSVLELTLNSLRDSLRLTCNHLRLFRL